MRKGKMPGRTGREFNQRPEGPIPRFDSGSRNPGDIASPPKVVVQRKTSTAENVAEMEARLERVSAAIRNAGLDEDYDDEGEVTDGEGS